VETCTLCGAPAPFARDDLIAPAARPYDDRLDQPAGRNRFGEFSQGCVVEAPPRLIGIRLDVGDRQQRQPASDISGDRLLARDVAKQCR
jgi:hypothetical protein